MKRLTAAIALLLTCLAAMPAGAAGLAYYPDPVYKKLAPDDHSPMDDILDLAKQGDPRAQFMIGDLYAKGKGGLPKDTTEARRWFEESAMHEYDHSFIRLAALAKREKKPVEALQWYKLALDSFSRNDPRKDFIEEARKKLIEDNKLSDDDISAAKKAANAWEDARDKHLDDEAKQKEEKAKQAATAITPTGEKENEQN